ncbi:MAG: cell wall hydrolase [Sphingomicrobium sp.]
MKVVLTFLRSFRGLTWLKGGVVALLTAGTASLAVYAWSSAETRPDLARAAAKDQPSQLRPVALDLPPPDLIRPLTPAEAGEENAERPIVHRSDRPAAGFTLKAGAPGNAQALTCLTQAVYYEAASEGVDGGRAVAQIVLNRMRHPGFPPSVCAVVYQGSERSTGCQFSFTCDGSLSRVPVASIWTRSRKIAEGALAGKVFAPVGHATHYHADYVVPYWADSLDKIAQIGRHIFYRLRGTLGDGRRFSQPYSGLENMPLATPKTLETGDLLAASPIKGMSELIAEEASRELREPSHPASLPVDRPLADTASGTLIDSVDSALRKPLRRKNTECAGATESKQVKALQPNQIDATGGGQVGC